MPESSASTCVDGLPAHSVARFGPIIPREIAEFDSHGLANARQWATPTYSVEELSFCAFGILPIDHFIAENQP
jgi:hypothetical protein